MTRIVRTVLLLGLLFTGCSAGTPTGTPPSGKSPLSPPPVAVNPNSSPVPGLRIQVVAGGLDSPTYLTAPPGERDRLFVLEQAGRVRIIQGGNLLAAPFLDISSRVKSGGEQGLLGMAFHPAYARNGQFYLHYSDLNGDTQISRFGVSGSDPNRADPATEITILHHPQPFPNHNGGDIKFGPDGYFYIALGDGGSRGDPSGNGQNLGTLLGSLLRVDVDRGNPYAIPADNPFLKTPGARPEIWAYGLRNPWRFAFDRSTGDLFIADVGQDLYEEVDVSPAGRKGGENYGWNILEGNHCFLNPACNTTGLTPPVLEYDRSQGCSITGGYVYRGARIPAVQGHYFYSDYCTAFIRSFRLVNGQVTDHRDWTALLNRDLPGPIQLVSSFGEDAEGELYLLQHGRDGRVYRFVPAS